jgi:hypothetical protein
MLGRMHTSFGSHSHAQSVDRPTYLSFSNPNKHTNTNMHTFIHTTFFFLFITLANYYSPNHYASIPPMKVTIRLQLKILPPWKFKLVICRPLTYYLEYSEFVQYKPFPLNRERSTQKLVKRESRKTTIGEPIKDSSINTTQR